MDAAEYNAWYDTPRGRWIGETEFRLARHLLAPQPSDTLVDVGCGTGWFTRRFAEEGCIATGLDINGSWLAFAREQNGANTAWVEGDASCLPFPERQFDLAVSIAALCFVADERKAVSEVVRVTKRRFAIGWLNRSSLLYRAKAGHGAYKGAHWRTRSEVRSLFDGLPVHGLVIRSAVFLPSGQIVAELLEDVVPGWLPWGAILVAAGNVARAPD